MTHSFSQVIHMKVIYIECVASQKKTAYSESVYFEDSIKKLKN